MSDQTYWLLDDSRELAAALVAKHDKFYTSSANPIVDTWCKNTYFYNSNVIESQSPYTALGFVGEQGELVRMRVPQARSLIRQALSLITKQKLAFAAVAENSDKSVVEEMRIADAIAEDTVKTQTVDLKGEQLAEDGLVIGTGYLDCTWRTDKGMPFMVDEQGAVIFEGDNEISTLEVTDVMFPYGNTNWDNNPWVEVRRRRNRWDLIAQFPEMEQAIVRLPSSTKSLKQMAGADGWEDEDTIFVYELYVRPSPAVTKGRMMFYSDPDTVYMDGENLYGCIPVEQYKPEPIKGMGFGYPLFSTLLPAQEMLDHEFSATATNHSAFGIHNIAAPRGAAIEVQELNGLNLLSYTPQPIPGGGKPEALQLMQSSENNFKFIEVLLGHMQQMSNVNAALRGDVGPNTAGVAIATLTTNALEFFNSYIKSYIGVMERVMFHAINNLTRFAKQERMVRLVGKNHQTYLKKFKGEQLQAVRALKMQAVNPLMQTLSGRLEIAEKSADRGMVNMKEYCGILDGQPLNTLFETDQSQEDLIATENQMLQDGVEVVAIGIDDHPQHIYKHRALLNSQEARKDKRLFAMVMDHIMDHRRLADEQDPVLLAMANTGKMPEMAPPMPGAGGPEQGPPPEKHGGGGGPSADMGPESKAMNPDSNKPAVRPAQAAKDMLGRAG